MALHGHRASRRRSLRRSAPARSGDERAFKTAIRRRAAAPPTPPRVGAGGGRGAGGIFGGGRAPSRSPIAPPTVPPQSLGGPAGGLQRAPSTPGGGQFGLTFGPGSAQEAPTEQSIAQLRMLLLQQQQQAVPTGSFLAGGGQFTPAAVAAGQGLANNPLFNLPPSSGVSGPIQGNLGLPDPLSPFMADRLPNINLAQRLLPGPENIGGIVTSNQIIPGAEGLNRIQLDQLRASPVGQQTIAAAEARRLELGLQEQSIISTFESGLITERQAQEALFSLYPERGRTSADTFNASLRAMAEPAGSMTGILATLPETLVTSAAALSPNFNPLREGRESGELRSLVESGRVQSPSHFLNTPASNLEEVAAFAPNTVEALANFRDTIPDVAQEEIDARRELYGDDFLSPEEITQIAFEKGVLPEDVLAAAREIGLLSSQGVSSAGDKLRRGGSSTTQFAREGQFQTLGIGI